MNGESSNISFTAEEQLKAQRRLLHSLCIAVLILTGTFFVYLYRQVVAIRKSTAEMVRFMTQYEKSDTAVAIERVQRQLDEYRKTNPEFNPIYVKYFGTNSPMPTLSSKVSTNAP
jgi:Tfp pilus assembly protein PilO